MPLYVLLLHLTLFSFTPLITRCLILPRSHKFLSSHPYVLQTFFTRVTIVRHMPIGTVTYFKMNTSIHPSSIHLHIGSSMPSL
ncbi:uncharacterized protein EI90DRAFT_3060167 [Cantharellus anzutake]|uniref:uncharacterized protein n=1 Tax=Cantharellus anzutake TaxID=1750568 RepID=UPI001908FFE7|nr:uncharacterized protein EI90DRAFT_3060167 [Cantharellus anzutake]KAF8330302.1 hypothetical protein EI90DRAFT_3060167 [Cantharellus anzutake]